MSCEIIEERVSEDEGMIYRKMGDMERTIMYRKKFWTYSPNDSTPNEFTWKNHEN